ncbi:MAG: AMP-binding protein [Bacteroidota bacterium]|nr:AMP-binding protein [Bacteroidota bacterium]
MRTIPRLFDDSVEKFHSNPFLWEKTGTAYNSLTYGQTKKLVYEMAKGLYAAGIKKGDRVAIISEGRNYWVISELAILCIGAINVPLSVKLEASEVEFRIKHAACKMLIVSGGQSKKTDPFINKINEIESIIYLDEMSRYVDKGMHISELIKKGVDQGMSKIEEIKYNIAENDYANICYTSGTTADPKGIILSHLNYYANVDQALSLMSIPPTYRTLLILPLDHSFAHTAGIYSFMRFGASIASVQIGKSLNETLRNIPINIKEIKPNVLLSVPALAKNFRKNIEKGIREKGPKVEKLFKNAMQTAYEYNGIGWDKGKGQGLLKKMKLAFYDKILFSKIRENFGGELKYFIGGGALLDIDLQKFFYAIGIPMYQGYGLSEAAPIISSNAPAKHKLGSSGFLVSNLELKICDDKGNALKVGEKGEIVVKGENVMIGYWKNEKATAEALKDGWLFTGDLGYMDADGFLYVLGRFKSLLIGHDGEKYSPEGIEETLIEHSPCIDQCMLHNNQDAYTVGLIVPNKEALKRILKKKGIDPKTDDGIKAALLEIQLEINKYKNGGKHEGIFPERWLPSSVAILDEGFTEANHLLNSTLKMVRGKINERYADTFEFLYTKSSAKITNDENMKVMRELMA